MLNEYELHEVHESNTHMCLLVHIQFRLGPGEKERTDCSAYFGRRDETILSALLREVSWEVQYFYLHWRSEGLDVAPLTLKILSVAPHAT